MQKFALGLGLTLCFSLLPFSSNLHAQGAEPGYMSEPLELALPIFNASFTLNENGETIVFDGLTVERYAPDGTSLELYGTLPGFGFPSFVVVSNNRRYGLVGESSNGVVYALDLRLGTLTAIDTLTFNYDAAIGDDGIGYVSAAATGISGVNGIYRIDTEGTNMFELIATVPGFSGPVALPARSPRVYPPTT